MTAQEWTLDELIGKVAEQLDDTAYAGAPNGRVRDVPDVRAVRWYTTIGLVDRPVMRGRTAWYGPRHLAQLVAIKRRQSQGFKIAEIQAELAEAPDEVLQRIADLSDVGTIQPAAIPRRFWTQHPAEYVAAEPATEVQDGAGQPKPGEPVRATRGRREIGEGRPVLDQIRPGGSGRIRPEIERVRPEPGSTGPAFEHVPPAPAEPEAPEGGEPGRERPAHGSPERERPAGGTSEPAPSGQRRQKWQEQAPAGVGHASPGRRGLEARSTPAGTGLLSGVPLGGGAVLLLNTTPTEGDLEAIRDAARELMDLLATRGLITSDETTTRRGNAT